MRKDCNKMAAFADNRLCFFFNADCWQNNNNKKHFICFSVFFFFLKSPAGAHWSLFMASLPASNTIKTMSMKDSGLWCNNLYFYDATILSAEGAKLQFNATWDFLFFDSGFAWNMWHGGARGMASKIVTQIKLKKFSHENTICISIKHMWHLYCKGFLIYIFMLLFWIFGLMDQPLMRARLIIIYTYNYFIHIYMYI